MGGPQPEPAAPRPVLQRAFITTLDQGVSSVSNFAVGVVVARLAGIAGLGAYALAYAAWLLVAAMHRALVTDPMAIMGDARHPTETKANLQKGFAAEVTLGLSSGVVVALLGLCLVLAGQRSIGLSQLAVAPWITFLLLQDYWRWVGFMQAKPGKALANDLVFDIVQGCGFAALLVAHVHSTPLAIAAWGLGAMGGSLCGLWQFGVRPSLSKGLGWLKAKWHISRWLAASSTSGWGFTQLYGILTAAMLGPAALGGLKAAQNLVSGPAFVLVMAGGSLGLPEASRAYDQHGWHGLRRVARFITGAGLASVGLVFVSVLLFGRAALGLIYGHQFTSYAPVAYVMGLAYMVNACSLGAIMRLKVVKRTRLLFGVSLWGLLVSTVWVIALAVPFGVDGVASGYAVGTGLYTAGLIIAARWAERRERPTALAHEGSPRYQNRTPQARSSYGPAVARARSASEPGVLMRVRGRGQRRDGPLRVGLFGLFGSGNLGNDGSLEAMLAFLRERHPEAVVDVKCPGPRRVSETYGVDAEPLQWYTSRAGRARGIIGLPLKVLGKVVDIFRAFSWARRHDVVIVPGTGILESTLRLRASATPYNLLLLCASARLCGTKVALVSVGANVSRRRLTRWLFSAAARLASYRSYRDDQSLDAMRRLGLDTTRDHVYPDLVFSLPTPAGHDGDPRAVGVCVMAYYGSGDDQEPPEAVYHRYVEDMKSFVRWLVDNGREIRLFWGDDVDQAVAQEVLDDLASTRPQALKTTASPARFSSLSDQLQQMALVGTVVATRYHNVLCGLKLCKPTISVGYSAKHEALMAEAGLSEFTQSARAIDIDKLKEQFTELEKRASDISLTLAVHNLAKVPALEYHFNMLSSLLAEPGAPPLDLAKPAAPTLAGDRR